MGWSFGCVSLLALLGQTDVIPEESQKKLASYIRLSIFYGKVFLRSAIVFNIMF